jgi:4-hydroxybenzoyl-CoA reductase subunit beta
MNHLTRRPTEILAHVHVPRRSCWRSTYWKLRLRGSFDFPVLSVAAGAQFARDNAVEEARIVLGAIASCPLEVPEAAATLVGAPLTDEAIERAAQLAAHVARPMDNTDFGLIWRKPVVRDFVCRALRELRGDDVRDLRRGIARAIACWPAGPATDGASTR